MFLDICSDWSTNVEELALASTQRDAFELSETPVPSTIQVFVNDVELVAGWEYRAASNEVAITDINAIPSSGDIVDITYGGGAVPRPADRFAVSGDDKVAAMSQRADRRSRTRDPASASANPAKPTGTVRAEIPSTRRYSRTGQSSR